MTLTPPGNLPNLPPTHPQQPQPSSYVPYDYSHHQLNPNSLYDHHDHDHDHATTAASPPLHPHRQQQQHQHIAATINSILTPRPPQSQALQQKDPRSNFPHIDYQTIIPSRHPELQVHPSTPISPNPHSQYRTLSFVASPWIPPPRQIPTLPPPTPCKNPHHHPSTYVIVNYTNLSIPPIPASPTHKPPIHPTHQPHNQNHNLPKPQPPPQQQLPQPPQPRPPHQYLQTPSHPPRQPPIPSSTQQIQTLQARYPMPPPASSYHQDPIPPRHPPQPRPQSLPLSQQPSIPLNLHHIRQIHQYAQPPSEIHPPMQPQSPAYNLPYLPQSHQHQPLSMRPPTAPTPIPSPPSHPASTAYRRIRASVAPALDKAKSVSNKPARPPASAMPPFRPTDSPSIPGPPTPATSTTLPFPATPSSPENNGGSSSNGSAPREHACTFPGCTKTFERRYNLTVHYRRHTDEMPYPCKFEGCMQKFKWRSSQSHHMKTRHQNQMGGRIPVHGRGGRLSTGRGAVRVAERGGPVGASRLVRYGRAQSVNEPMVGNPIGSQIGGSAEIDDGAKRVFSPKKRARTQRRNSTNR